MPITCRQRSIHFARAKWLSHARFARAFWVDALDNFCHFLLACSFCGGIEQA